LRKILRKRCKMLSKKEKIILKHLRNNARKSISQIAKEEKVPFLELVEAFINVDSRIIKKYTTLLDFEKIGYPIRSIFILNGDKEVLNGFLTTHPNINNVSRLSDNGFYAEAAFRSMKEYYEFNSVLDKLNLKRKVSHPIIKEIKREEFQI